MKKYILIGIVFITALVGGNKYFYHVGQEGGKKELEILHNCIGIEATQSLVDEANQTGSLDKYLEEIEQCKAEIVNS